MNELLPVLLSKLESAGDTAILTGRDLGSLNGPDLNHLIQAKVLEEQPPLDLWEVCGRCICKQSSRSITPHGNVFIAKCPLHVRESIILQPGDLENYRINANVLVNTIASASKLAQPKAISDGIWMLGSTPSSEVIFIVFSAKVMAQFGLTPLLKAEAEGRSVILVGPQPGDAKLDEFTRAGINFFTLSASLRCAAPLAVLEPSAINVARLTSCRLTLWVSKRQIKLDGRTTVLPGQSFKLLSLLARTAKAGKPHLSHHEMFVATERGGDLVQELRNRLKENGARSDLIESVRGYGYRLSIESHEVEICP